MKTRNKPVSQGKAKRPKRQAGLHNTFLYVKQHWRLYVIFLLPALALTLIFKYLPMGGILIAFQDYNPIRGILGSRWVGLKYFERFISSPDFLKYLVNTLKLSIYGMLWGFPIPIILALLLNRIQSSKIKQKIQLVLYIMNGFTDGFFRWKKTGYVSPIPDSRSIMFVSCPARSEPSGHAAFCGGHLAAADVPGGVS